MDIKGRNFGGRMRYARVTRGFSRETLAKAIGVSVTDIINYEDGYIVPDAETVENITKLLEVPAESLYGAEDDLLLNDPARNPDEDAKIPIFGKDGCRYIMQLDTDYAREYIKLPNFFRTRIGRFVAVYAPDNCMDGAKIKKDSIVILRWLSVSLCDDAKTMRNRIDNEMESGKIYAFMYRNKLHIRRIYISGGKFSVSAQSELYNEKPVVLDYDEITVLGQCTMVLVDFNR